MTTNALLRSHALKSRMIPRATEFNPGLKLIH